MEKETYENPLALYFRTCVACQNHTLTSYLRRPARIVMSSIKQIRGFRRGLANGGPEAGTYFEELWPYLGNDQAMWKSFNDAHGGCC